METFERANQRTHFFAQIETLKARENVEEICSVESLAGIFVGPGDLSTSLGKPAAFGDPEVIGAVAVDALGAIGSGSPMAMKLLESAVEDDDRDVRVAAVQLCVQHKYPGILSKVESAIKGKLLRGSNLAQKKPFFEAYGLFVGDAGVAPLYDMLNGGYIFRRKDDPETRACAAMALGKIGTPRAIAALEKALGIKDRLVRNAVGNALREIRP